MATPLLYRQLQDQLRQWVQPKDQRHLQGFAEILAAILQSTSACLGKWIPYLSHRDCQARAHMERLSYFVHNEQITAERFYEPILRHVLQAFAGESVLLTLDTSMLWNQFCLIEVLDCAALIALMLGMLLVQAGARSRLDWHTERGLSFLQLGLRELARLCYERLPLPKLLALPTNSPPPACASHRKREALDCRIEFSKVVKFS